jgi:hypothetical protein
MEQWWNDIDKGKVKNSEENMSQRHVVTMWTDVSEVCTASIHFNMTTLRYIPEDSKLQL